MSNRAITWAYRQDLKAGAKFVLVTLADMADQEHSCYPGVEQLSQLTGLGRTAVLNAIATLTDLGHIAAERRHRKDGSRTSNRYYLDVDGALTADTQSTESGPSEAAGQVRNPASLSPESEQPKSGIRTPILEPKVNPQTEPPEETLDAREAESQPELIAIDAQPPAGFDQFWAAWPRKDGRKAALAAWAKAIRHAPAAVIVAAAAEYAASPWRPERQFVPHGATWLNGERWADPPPQPPEQRTGPRPLTNAERAFAELQAETGRMADGPHRSQAALDHGLSDRQPRRV